MEGISKPKRLRKTTEILKELESLASEPNPSPIPSSSESEEFCPEQLPKKKEKKNQAPKLKIFNKLLDFTSYKDEYTIEEFEYLRDQPLDFENSSKRAKKELDHTVFKDNSYKASNTLVKSVLTNKDKRDSLIIKDPKVSGFFCKNSSQNSREIFREGLKSQINLRKTNHIDNDGIFDKPATDFEKKEKIQCEASNGSAEFRGEEVRSAENSKNFIGTGSYLSTGNSSPVYLPKEKSRVSKFVENEAEESGDESLSETEEDEDQGFLKELICDEPVDTDKNYEKHIKDMLEKEEKELKMVVNGEFKRKKLDEKIFAASKKLKPSPSPVKSLSIFSKPQEDFDEDSLIQEKKHQIGIKNFIRQQKPSLILDEKSTDYLKLLQRPEPTCIFKSLLSNPPKFSSTPDSSLKSSSMPTQPKPAKAFFISRK